MNPDTDTDTASSDSGYSDDFDSSAAPSPTKDAPSPTKAPETVGVESAPSMVPPAADSSTDVSDDDDDADATSADDGTASSASARSGGAKDAGSDGSPAQLAAEGSEAGSPARGDCPDTPSAAEATPPGQGDDATSSHDDAAPDVQVAQADDVPSTSEAAGAPADGAGQRDPEPVAAGNDVDREAAVSAGQASATPAQQEATPSPTPTREVDRMDGAAMDSADDDITLPSSDDDDDAADRESAGSPGVDTAASPGTAPRSGRTATSAASTHRSSHGSPVDSPAESPGRADDDADASDGGYSSPASAAPSEHDGDAAYDSDRAVDDGDEGALIDAGTTTRVPDVPAVDPAQRDTDQTAGGQKRRSPRERLRLPALKRGQVASDMITRLVEQPLDLQQQTAPWREGAPAGQTGNDAAMRRADFSYESTQDRYLARYWQRKDEVRRQWQRDAERRKRRKQQREALRGAGGRATSSQAPQRGHGSSPRDRAGTAPAPDSPSSMGSPRSRADAPWNVSSFPLNSKPVSAEEFGALRTIFLPGANATSKIKVPNVDLQWMRPVMEGKAADAGETMRTHATRSLRTLPYEALAEDHQHYCAGNPYTKVLINSPRSTLVLLRNGTQAYDLLERPAKFYASPSETVTPGILRGRRERADAERRGLVQSLQNAYDAVCSAFSLEDVAKALQPRTADGSSSAALVAEKLEKDRRQLEFLNERQRRIEEAARHRQHENAQKALSIATMLKEKDEKKREVIRAKAEAAAAEQEAKRRVMERIGQEQERLNAEVAAAAEAKRERIHHRVEELKVAKHERAVQRRAEKEERAVASRRKVGEVYAARISSLESAEAVKRERAQQYQQRVAQERAQRAERNEDQAMLRELNRLRAEKLASGLRDRVEAKLEAAEERHEEFEKERDRERRLRSTALRKRHEGILRAVQAAQALEEERADRVRERQERTAAEVAARQAKRAEALREEGEQSAFAIAHKRRVVDLTAQQQQFAKLCQLAQIQAREAEIGDFERRKHDLVEATRHSRTELQLNNRSVKEAAAADALRLERETAQAIYEIDNPRLSYKPPAQLTDVAPRIDAGRSHSSMAKASKRAPKRAQSSLA